MARTKKKRNKRYQGADARLTTPTVMRVSAEERSALKEWWLTYGRIVRIAAIAAGILLILVITVVGIVGLFTR
jgi:hypothetical protein